MLKCCNKPILQCEIWLLEDLKNFTARKLYTAKCPICKENLVILYEKRISDGKIFKQKYTKLEAIKTLYREKKRIAAIFHKTGKIDLNGWLYGHNVEIKNKQGKVVQIRQYASDFYNNKRLVKKIFI